MLKGCQCRGAYPSTTLKVSNMWERSLDGDVEALLAAPTHERLQGLRGAGHVGVPTLRGRGDPLHVDSDIGIHLDTNVECQWSNPPIREPRHQFTDKPNV